MFISYFLITFIFHQHTRGTSTPKACFLTASLSISRELEADFDHISSSFSSFLGSGSDICCRAISCTYQTDKNNIVHDGRLGLYNPCNLGYARIASRTMSQGFLRFR